MVSDIFIGIKKQTYAKYILLLNKFPDILRDSAHQMVTTDTAVYWRFLDYDWIKARRDMQHVVNFLNTLPDEEFGYIDLDTSDGTTDILGEPCLFGMHPQFDVEMPVKFE